MQGSLSMKLLKACGWAALVLVLGMVVVTSTWREYGFFAMGGTCASLVVLLRI